MARHLTLTLVFLLVLVVGTLPAMASPGLCVGPVCGDEFSRSAQYHWQLRLRVNDQQGHRERLVVDCRSGTLSPQQGLVERGYAGAVARRACRLVGEGMAQAGGVSLERQSVPGRAQRPMVSAPQGDPVAAR
jgi:hypothetical protein